MDESISIIHYDLSKNKYETVTDDTMANIKSDSKVNPHTLTKNSNILKKTDILKIRGVTIKPCTKEQDHLDLRNSLFLTSNNDDPLKIDYYDSTNEFYIVIYKINEDKSKNSRYKSKLLTDIDYELHTKDMAELDKIKTYFYNLYFKPKKKKKEKKENKDDIKSNAVASAVLQVMKGTDTDDDSTKEAEAKAAAEAKAKAEADLRAAAEAKAAAEAEAKARDDAMRETLEPKKQQDWEAGVVASNLKAAAKLYYPVDNLGFEFEAKKGKVWWLSMRKSPNDPSLKKKIEKIYGSLSKQWEFKDGKYHNNNLNVNRDKFPSKNRCTDIKDGVLYEVNIEGGCTSLCSYLKKLDELGEGPSIDNTLGKIGVMIAGNSGRPAGKLGQSDGTVKGVKPSHTTQEEDMISNWLITRDGENNHNGWNITYGNTLHKAWGLIEPHTNRYDTIQGINYYTAKDPSCYADAWVEPYGVFSPKIYEQGESLTDLGVGDVVEYKKDNSKSKSWWHTGIITELVASASATEAGVYRIKPKNTNFDPFTLQNKAPALIRKVKKRKFIYDTRNKFAATIVFVAGPCANPDQDPTKTQGQASIKTSLRGDTNFWGSQPKTFSKASQSQTDGYIFFRKAVKAAVRVGLDAMAKEKVQVAMLARVSCGIYAGKVLHERAINEDFIPIVTEILNEPVSSHFIRGQYFKYVLIPNLGKDSSDHNPEENIITIKSEELHRVLSQST